LNLTKASVPLFPIKTPRFHYRNSLFIYYFCSFKSNEGSVRYNSWLEGPTTWTTSSYNIQGMNGGPTILADDIVECKTSGIVTRSAHMSYRPAITIETQRAITLMSFQNGPIPLKGKIEGYFVDSSIIWIAVSRIFDPSISSDAPSENGKVNPGRSLEVYAA
jgi:hypothetical protein